MQPRVSIIFPCYNAESFLDHSLGSILAQTYTNLEVICINDGSKDNTLNLLKAYQEKDSRIVIVNNTENIGLTNSLNKSLAHITGEYFARMDADDFSPPERIATQVGFLIKHPQYDLVSSGYHYFRKDGSRLEYIPAIATLPNALKFISLFSTPLAHGAVLGKTSLIRDKIYFYDPGFPHAEDFELFSRLSWQNVPLTNIRASLYWARLNEGSVSAIYNSLQIRTNQQIIRRNLRDYFGMTDTISDDILKIVSSRIDTVITLNDLKTAFALLEQFYTLAQKKLHFTENEEKEIRHHLNLQKLNILIQSNKIRFMKASEGNAGFFMASLALLRPAQLLPLFKKLAKLFFTLK